MFDFNVKRRKASKASYSKLEVSAAEFIPYHYHYDNETIITKNKELMQVIQIDGYSFETADDEDVDMKKMVRNSLYKSMSEGTIAIWFQVRAGKLNCHVFMRSSDAWLGIPYDVFNFSMLAHLVCCELNVDGSQRHHFEPGTLYLTAASSHLYEEHFESAYHCSIDRHPDASFPETPLMMHLDKRYLMSLLKELRDTSPGSPLRWWEAR